MTVKEKAHLDQSTLAKFLWLAAPIPGAPEGLLHLVEACPACYRPLEAGGNTDTSFRHFPKDALGLFASRLADSGSQEGLAAFEHLLSKCGECHARAKGFLSALRSQLSVDWESEAFDSVAEKLSSKLAEWTQRAPAEKREAPELVEQLLEQPQGRRMMLVRNSDRYHTWPVVDRLCEASRVAAAADPADAVAIACVAIEICDSLDTAAYGSTVKADIAARAWAYRANAERAADDLEAAWSSMAQAEEYLAAGTQLDSARAEIITIRSYLESCQRQFTAARALAQEAKEIYRQLGDAHLQGRMHLVLAGIDLEEGVTEAAVTNLRSAVRLVDVEREPRVGLVVQQNLVLALADMERLEEAEAQLPAAWEICRAIGTRLDQLRLRWTEARIDAGLGRHHRAEVTLIDIKEAFKGLEQPYEAALAGLELALLYAEQGRAREMKLLALEMLPVFARNEIHREALAAMTIFAKAAAAESATLEIVEKTLHSLRRAASKQ